MHKEDVLDNQEASRHDEGENKTYYLLIADLSDGSPATWQRVCARPRETGQELNDE